MWERFCASHDGNVGNGQRKAAKTELQQRYSHSILSKSGGLLTFSAVQMNQSSDSTKNYSNWRAARKSPPKTASQLRFGKGRHTPTLFSFLFSATRRMRSPARKTTGIWEITNGMLTSPADEIWPLANDVQLQLAQRHRCQRPRLRSPDR